MKSEFYVLLSKDGLYYSFKHLDHYIMTYLLSAAQTFATFEEALDFNGNECNGQFGVSKVTIVVERVING